MGLWHKSDNLQSVVSSFSKERKLAKTTCTTILTILSDHQIRKPNELHEHALIQPLLNGKPHKYLYHWLNYLRSKGFIKKVKSTEKLKSWYISSSGNPKTLIMEFLSTYAKPKEEV
ncbi:MAG: hypothetical protein ACXAC8_07555 [Candidatus Hodarchaeales archaeon]